MTARRAIQAVEIAGICAALVLGGCTDDDFAGTDASADTGGDGGTQEDAGGDDGEGGDVEGGEVPTDPAALATWLAGDKYANWVHEAEAHPTNSTHFGDVQTYFSPLLAASLQAGSSSHPVGSAAVKELYDEQTGELSGWSVSVKADGSATGGDAWFWYEFVDDVEVVADFGEPSCTGCHASGTDFVKSSLP